MREIKFRGKDILNGEWIKGYLFYDYNNADEYRPFITYKSEAFLGGVNEQQIDKDTIGQYTGLKDKNGKEIYEGGIVKANWFDKTEVIGEIYFSMGCFILANSSVSDNQLFIFKNLEVIGNIYENPELLEDK